MAIHAADDGRFFISSHGGWIPGAYESERAARYAFKFSNAELQELQDKANEANGGTCGVITFANLQETRRKHKGS